MKQVVKWSLLGILAFLILLIIKLPASQVIYRANQSNDLSIEGVQGTIWNASASIISVNNITIEDVSWQVSFWDLLFGQMTLDIDGGDLRSSDKVSLQGIVSIDMFDPSHVQSSDLTVYLPADMAIAQAPLPIAVNAGGRFKVSLTELDYAGKCIGLSGKGQWLNAGLEGLVGLSEPLSLGNFQANLSCIEDDILVKITPPNVFNLTADARIPSTLKVKLNGQFKPDDSLPKQVRDAAQFFGRPDKQGFYKIKF
ncbi:MULTISPECIES: type II secretion system protein N [Alteromonadaceae]|uniref:type II secretion system protein N n=1 Tax=Alteromonadaceae TaxID=72275 RepID=UPI001C086575|nr:MULTISPECIES: type II secretion system protein N [Aliiglaciecola]MBU2877522.1 type II secretion system protein N [Aliiglaciecola lipolytica]MDO6711102.1 type II secretion system protein N [Aliiglaciecola sp. 2_MG-2023]MDO6752016.1 type II secretion system protein N [Aliiglaciecola sp. 1_MG-2023]